MSSLNRALSVTVLFSTALTSVGLTNPSKRPQEVASQNLAVIEMDIPTSELLSKPGERPYHVGGKVYVKVRVRNDSDQPIKVRSFDSYYQNRPQLFKSGKLIRYRTKIAEFIRSIEADPQFVSLRRSVSLMPYASADLRDLELNDWYGPLEPGSYRLINRYRFNIRGPWTADSAPLLFQVVPEP
ncbi:MAG TPA: hypothetical protein VK582_21740 [Pyrinomonadaceae bacterium]|nr:hypothetical protein [Pyrinomonadaceae bacterium]